MEPADLAGKINVHRQQIYDWESGKRTPGIESLCKIAEATSADPYFLLTGKQPERIAVEPSERALLEWFRRAHPYDREAVNALIKRDAEQKRHGAGGKGVGAKKTKNDAR